MKKTMTIFGAILFASVIMTSCGGKEDGTAEGAKSEAAAGKWDKLAQVNGLKPEDVQKAIEIGTKMGDCYQLESAPGKMPHVKLPYKKTTMAETTMSCLCFRNTPLKNKNVENP